MTAGEEGSTRHPDSFSPPQGWFQSVTPRGSGRSCLSSPWHLSLFRLPLESSPPFPWSLVGTLRSPLLSPHPSDISLSGLSHSEMSLELFRSKDSFVRMSHEPLRSKCPKLNSLQQPGLLPSGQEYHCPLRLNFSKTPFFSLLIPCPQACPPQPVDSSFKYVGQIVWLFSV